MAGANHGSAMAELGTTILGQIAQWKTKNGRTPGDQVLSDLDFGSDFLLRLNAEWQLARANNPRLRKLAMFSMGGDSIGDKTSQLYWASSERGCDNTVRISAANLNYTYLKVGDDGKLQPLVINPAPVPHLIVTGKSHWGPVSGILASNTANDQPTMVAIAEALSVPSGDDPAYATLASAWAKSNDDWMSATAVNSGDDPTITAAMTNADVNGNSTIVFNVQDRYGRSIEDCIISLVDATDPSITADTLATNQNLFVEGVLRLTSAMESRWPIHNQTERGSYTFYVNYKRFYDLDVPIPGATQMHHRITITAAVPGDCITFATITYETDPTIVHLVKPNQTTYVDVIMERDSAGAVQLYVHPATPTTVAWRPFPDNFITP